MTGLNFLAVPRPPIDPRAYRANRVIYEGAILVCDANDVFEVVRTTLKRSARAPQSTNIMIEQPRLKIEPKNKKARQPIIECLSPEPAAVDEIVRRCQLTGPVVRTILLKFELAGLRERLPGNRDAAL